MPKPLQEKKTIHSEGSCVLTSVFCGLSPSLTTKVVASWQVWVTPVTVLFTLSKPELKRRVSWWGQQRVARLRTQYSFPRLVRVNKLVPRLNEGRSETFQPYLIASGQSKEASWSAGWRCRKGLEEEEGKGSTPRLQWGEKLRGSPEVLTKGRSQRGAEGYNLCLGHRRQRRVGGGGLMAWKGGVT